MCRYDLRQAFALDVVLAPGLGEFGTNFVGKCSGIGRLSDVVVDLKSNGLESCLESGVAGEDECDRQWLRAAYGADHGESVSSLPHVKVRDEHVKALFANEFQ